MTEFQEILTFYFVSAFITGLFFFAICKVAADAAADIKSYSYIDSEMVGG